MYYEFNVKKRKREEEEEEVVFEFDGAWYQVGR
jgi:hypothetical protein